MRVPEPLSNTWHRMVCTGVAVSAHVRTTSSLCQCWQNRATLLCLPPQARHHEKCQTFFGQPLISSVYLAWSILQLSKAHFVACLQIEDLVSFPRQKRLECEYKCQIWSRRDVIVSLHFAQIPNGSLSNTFMEKPTHFHTISADLEKKIDTNFILLSFGASVFCSLS